MGNPSAIQKSLGLPKNAFSYLTSHGSLDLGHVEFFKTLMNRIENQDDKTAIIHTAKVMYTLYGNIFRSLPHKVQQSSSTVELQDEIA